MATRKSSRIAAKRRPLLKRLSRTPENGDLGMQCSICLGEITFRGRLSVCKHKFCYACILEWSKNTNTCPLCKKRFRCITRVCLLGRTPPRQVRVADRDGHMDYQDEDDDDDAITDNIRESIIDYLSCLTPHAQSNGATLNEYDYSDSFIDDSQLSDTNTPCHTNSVQYSSPVIHNVGRTDRRRAYLLDSDTDTTPHCEGRHVDDLIHNDEDNDVDCIDISHDSVVVVPDTPDRGKHKSPSRPIRKNTNLKSSNFNNQWLTTRKGKKYRRVGRQLNFL